MAAKKKEPTPIECPCCHKVLFRMYEDGTRTNDSAALSEEDEHGRYSICPHCSREIRMDNKAGVWVLALHQDCE
jgi:DNA-directed RNA polymerase subunit RPC12/RpoP